MSFPRMKLLLPALAIGLLLEATPQVLAQNDAARAVRIAETVRSERALAGQQLTDQQVQAVQDLSNTEETEGSNAASQRVVAFSGRSRAELLEEARLDRRRTRIRQKRKLSEIAGTEVERPELSETMPFAEGTRCELASSEYRFYPDDSYLRYTGFVVVTPPKTADVSWQDNFNLYMKACDCGWRKLPSAVCINLTEYELRGETMIYGPGPTPILNLLKTQ